MPRCGCVLSCEGPRWHPDLVSEAPAPSDGDFFEAVEQFVTPGMASHGYVVCSSGEGKASDTSKTLRRVPAWRTGRLRDLPRFPRRKRLVRHLSVGYEGDSGWEFWVEYLPERHGLDLTWWREVLGERADFDVSGS